MSSRGDQTHDLELFVSLDEEAQVEGVLQMLLNSVLCASFPGPPGHAANCSSELSALSEEAQVRIAVGVTAQIPLFGTMRMPVGAHVDRPLTFNSEARLKMHDAIASLRERAACAGGGDSLQFDAPGVSVGDFVFEGVSVPELSAERTRADASVRLRVNGSVHVRVPPLALRVCARAEPGDESQDSKGALKTLHEMPSFSRALANTSAPTSGCIGTLSVQPWQLGNGEVTIIGGSGVISYGHGAGEGESSSTDSAHGSAGAGAASRRPPRGASSRRGSDPLLLAPELSDMLSPLHFAELVSRGRSIRIRGATDGEAFEAARRLGGESTDDAAHEAARTALRRVQGLPDAPVAGSRCLAQRVLQGVSLELPLRRLLPPAINALVQDAAAASACLIGISVAYGINTTEQGAVGAQLDSGLILQDCVLFLSHVVEDSARISSLNVGELSAADGGIGGGYVQLSHGEAMAAALGDAEVRLADGALHFEPLRPRASPEGAGGACRLSVDNARAAGAFRPRRVGSQAECELNCLAEPTCAAIDFEHEQSGSAGGRCMLWTRMPLHVGPERTGGSCLRLSTAASAAAASAVSAAASAAGASPVEGEVAAVAGRVASAAAAGSARAANSLSGSRVAQSPPTVYRRVQLQKQLSMVGCHQRCAAGCLAAEYWSSSPAPLNCALWFSLTDGGLPGAVQPAPPPLMAPRAPPLSPPPAPRHPPPLPPAPPPPPPPRCEGALQDLALSRPVEASSSQWSLAAAVEHVVDGDGRTQWITGSVREAVITVELAEWSLIRRVELDWDEMSGPSWVEAGDVTYTIAIGSKGSEAVVAHVSSSASGLDSNVLPRNVLGESVRLAFSRSRETGFALWDLRVLGCARPGEEQAPRAPEATRPAALPQPVTLRGPSAALTRGPAADLAVGEDLMVPGAGELVGSAPADAAVAAIECYTRKDMSDYRGRVNRTVGGHVCQRWSEQEPHAHSFTQAAYPEDGLGEHNFCRAVGSSWAWCYTTVEKPSWQYCKVGQRQVHCPQSQELSANDRS